MGATSSVLLSSSNGAFAHIAADADGAAAGSDPLRTWLASASREEAEALEAELTAAARAVARADPAMLDRIISRARNVDGGISSSVRHIPTAARVESSVNISGEVEAFGVKFLEALNALRSDPLSFIPALERHLATFEDEHVHRTHASDGRLINMRTHEGRAGVQGAIDFLRTARPVQPLSLSLGLQRAAEDLVDDLRHGNPEARNDGSTLLARVERHALWSGRLAENCCWGLSSPEAALVSMLVDDGVPSRTHRLNLLEDDLRYMGAACGAHADYDFVCALDLACLAKDLELVVQGDVTVSSKEPDHPRASSLPEPSILSSGDATAATVTLGASTGGTLFDRVLESIPVPAIVEDVRRELCAPNPVEVEIEYSFAEKRADVRYVTKASRRTKKVRWGQTAAPAPAN